MFWENNGENPPKLAGIAAKKIKDMIIGGELASGEPLGELKIARMLGMSRTPVREAISMLEFEGIVRAIPGRGAIVVDITREDFQEINNIRAALEPLAAVSAISAIPRGVLAEQRVTWTRFLDDIESGTDVPTGDFAEADAALHNLFIYNCGNRRLTNILRGLQSQTKRYVFAHWETRAYLRESVSQHLDIIDSFEKFDSEAVRNSLIKHIEYNNMYVHIYINYNRAS
jgi:DNA-binding GntR family transcriptional regulator